MNLRIRPSRKQKLVLGTTVGLTIVTTLVVRSKYKGVVQAARIAGVDDWLIEMNNKNLVVMVLPPELANQVFDFTMDYATNSK